MRAIADGILAQTSSLLLRNTTIMFARRCSPVWLAGCVTLVVVYVYLQPFHSHTRIISETPAVDHPSKSSSQTAHSPVVIHSRSPPPSGTEQPVAQPEKISRENTAPPSSASTPVNVITVTTPSPALPTPRVCTLLGCAQYRDEEHAMPFQIESLLPHVDCIFAVDHGSVDFTTELIQRLFPDEIASGRVVLEYLSANASISQARQACLDFGNAHNTTYFMRLEADGVWFDESAAILSKAARALPADGPPHCLGMYFTNSWQNFTYNIPALISSIVFADPRWITVRSRDPGITFCRLKGVSAVGDYLDERLGKRPEGFYYGPGQNISVASVTREHPEKPKNKLAFVHYSRGRDVPRRLVYLDRLLIPHTAVCMNSMSRSSIARFEPLLEHPEAYGRLWLRYLEVYRDIGQRQGYPFWYAQYATVNVNDICAGLEPKD